MSNKRSSITVVTSRNRILLILILSGFIKLSRLDTTLIQATLKRYNTEYHFCLQYEVFCLFASLFIVVISFWY